MEVDTPPTITALLAELTLVAEDRIRDSRRASLLLCQLLRAVTPPAPPTPALPIIRRLCYYANANGSAIRSATLRILRLLATDRAAALVVLGERLLLSIVRSLERAPAYLWERVQALRLARKLLELAPDAAPPALLRCLQAIACYASEASSGAGSGGGSGYEAPAGSAAAAAAAAGRCCSGTRWAHRPASVRRTGDAAPVRGAARAASAACSPWLPGHAARWRARVRL